MDVYELIGYIASILIAISLMMRSVLRLRVLNLIGAVFFTAYGLLIGAYPVAAVNFFIVLIDLYYLYEILTDREYFSLLEVQPDSRYLQRFLDYYEAEIHQFLPNFRYHAAQDPFAVFVLRDMLPAGLILGHLQPPGSLRLELDFAIPGYRDFKSGRFVYRNQAGFFRQHGIQRIYSPPGNPTHAAYLRRMGFQPETGPDGDVLYCLEVETR